MKLTPEYIAARVVSARYWQPEGTTLTVCALTLVNGFHVVGQSACIYPEEFKKDLGEKLAYADAVQKIWSLEGYLAKTLDDAFARNAVYQERA